MVLQGGGEMREPTERDASTRWPTWWRRALAWVAVVGLQLGLLAYFGGANLLSDAPVAGLDYDTHISQTWRVLEGLEGWGQTWVYDVRLLAGYPNGTIFDADNKGWELTTYALHQAGLSRGLAFNMFVLAAHLLVVPVLYLAARVFGLAPWASLAAAALGMLYWNFDSWNHWCWYVGMTAFAMVSYMCLLPLALFWRWLEDRRPWQIVFAAVALAVCHLVHPYAFFLLAVPMLVLYAMHARSLGWRGHAAVTGMAALTIVVNAYWLLVAFDFWHYILDSSFFAKTGVSSVLYDTFGVMTDPAVTGIIGKRAGFRTVMIACAVVMLWVWRRRGDARQWPIGVAMLTMFLVAYLGSYTFLVQTQPYRNVGPLGFFAAIATAALLQLAIDERVFAKLTRGGRVLAGLLSLPAALFLAQEAIYFLFEMLPIPSKLPHGQEVQMTALGYPKHAAYEYADWHADELAQWVREHDDGSGRFLVDGWSWGEQLTWKTDAQILGGFIWRNMQHSWANFFRRRPQGIANDAELERYFRTYAVKWVILSTPRSQTPWWDKSRLLQHELEMFPFRIFRVKTEVGLIAKGPGRVEAQTNEIRVFGTDPDSDVVLRYHWLDTLRCEPDCTIVRRKVRGPDTVGFISVPAPHPADFAIVNRYGED